MADRNPGQTGSTRIMKWARRLRDGVIWWCALFVVWLLLVDSFAPPELIAGVGAATLALPIVFVVSAHVERRYRLRMRWLKELRQTPLGVLRDTLLVCRTLVLHLSGREPMRGAFRLVPFDVGAQGVTTGDDVAANSWQAFATIATSVTPNTYVIGIDAERGVALVHQLHPTAPGQVRESVIGASPVARPDATASGEVGT
ncbi:MAG TPA: hypothetical protein VFN78_08405 [Ktedonobacterales bacterium]|nr:hypothetical protein [Ktedonobacterales bacterium]